MSAPAIVYVVDDDASVRRSLSRLFRSTGLQVEPFETAEAFLRHRRADAPGCLVLDVQLPGRSGVDLLAERRQHEVDLPVVFLTGHGDFPMVVRAMRGGAFDFLAKPVEPEQLISSVRRAIEEHECRRAESTQVAEFQRRLRDLTRREREVATLVVSGQLNKQIASELGISIDTVKVHRARLVRKLGVQSVAELVRLWERSGADQARTLGPEATHP